MKKSEIRKIIKEEVQKILSEEKFSIPTTLKVGTTYPTRDGGSIKILKLWVQGFHKNAHETYADHIWISPEGKKGQASASISSLKQNYF